jgi:hypothetical protein
MLAGVPHLLNDAVASLSSEVRRFARSMNVVVMNGVRDE